MSLPYAGSQDWDTKPGWLSRATGMPGGVRPGVPQYVTIPYNARAAQPRNYPAASGTTGTALPYDMRTDLAPIPPVRPIYPASANGKAVSAPWQPDLGRIPAGPGDNLDQQIAEGNRNMADVMAQVRGPAFGTNGGTAGPGFSGTPQEYMDRVSAMRDAARIGDVMAARDLQPLPWHGDAKHQVVQPQDRATVPATTATRAWLAARGVTLPDNATMADVDIARAKVTAGYSRRGAAYDAYQNSIMQARAQNEAIARRARMAGIDPALVWAKGGFGTPVTPMSVYQQRAAGQVMADPNNVNQLMQAGLLQSGDAYQFFGGQDLPDGRAKPQEPSIP